MKALKTFDNLGEIGCLPMVKGFYCFDVTKDLEGVALFGSADDLTLHIDSLVGNEIKEALYSYFISYDKYDMRPAVVNTPCGALVLFGDLVPTSSLVLAALTDLSFNKVAGILERYHGDKYTVLGDLSGTAVRRSSRVMETFNRLELLTKWVNDIFASCDAPTEYTDITPWFTLMTSKVSTLLGYRVSFTQSEEIFVEKEFDRYLSLTFLMITALMSKKYGDRDQLTVELEKQSFGAKITSCFTNRCTTSLSTFESILLWDIAQRKNMFFDIERADDLTRISFVPLNRDWAYLELKERERAR